MREPLGAGLRREGPERGGAGVLLPALDELLHARALDEAGERIVLPLAAGALRRVFDPGRSALEHEPRDGLRAAKRERERESCAHRVAEDLGGRVKLAREAVERVVPRGRVRRIAVPRQNRRRGALEEAQKWPGAPGEPVQHQRAHGGSPSAAITAACSARCWATFSARSVRASTMRRPAPGRCNAERSARPSATRTKSARQRRAAPSRSRPCGVAKSSSKRSACSAIGRNWKMPPPSLLMQTTVRGSCSRAAATRPPRSW